METVETVEMRGVVDVAEWVETVETVETGGWEEGSAGEEGSRVWALEPGSFLGMTRMSSAREASNESSTGYLSKSGNVETEKEGREWRGG